MKNKKAAIGATMTWIVATIIIIFVILLFVYGASFMALLKGQKVSAALEEKGVYSIDTQQTLLAMLQTKTGADDKTIQQLVEEIKIGIVISEGHGLLKEELESIWEKIPNNEFLFEYGDADKSKWYENEIRSTSDYIFPEKSKLSSDVYFGDKRVHIYETTPIPWT